MNRKKIELTLLTILIAAHIFCNFIWINSNSNALIFQAKSWQKNINIYSELKNNLADFREYSNNETNFGKFYKLIVIDEYSPPFYFWAAALANLALVRIFPQAMLLTSSLFFIFLLIIVYKMGEYLCKGSGMLSAFICSLYPFIYLSSRFFNMALAVGVMVTLSVYVLLRTEMFEKKAHSVFLGVCLGLGMLTKYTFFLFLIGPVSAVIFEIIKKRKNDSIWRQRRNNLLVSLAIAAAISGAYYFNYRVMFLLFFRGFNLDQAALDMTIVQRALFYLRMLIVKEIGIVTAVFTLGLGVLFFRNKFVFKKTMGLWIFLSFILLAITPKHNPQPEYMIPLLPAIALISGVVINSFKKNLIKYSITVGLCVIMLAQFFQPYYPDKVFCFSKETHEIENIFRQIGSQKNKVGYICAGSERDKFLGIEAFLSLWSDDLAEVYDFFVSPREFIEDLEKFDFLVNVTYTREEWPDEESLAAELTEYCGQYEIALLWKDAQKTDFSGSKLVISKPAIEKIVDLIDGFKKIDYFYFSPEHLVKGPHLKISVFRKKGLEAVPDIKYASKLKNLSNIFAREINKFAFFNALDSIKMLKYAKEPLSSFAIIDRVNSKEYGFKFEQVKDKLIFAELIDMARESRGNRQYRESLEVLKKTLNFDFDNELVFEELDQLFITWKEPEKAISFYHALRSVFPESKEIFLRLSRQYKISQDYDNVKKYYRKVLKLDPNCEEAKKGMLNDKMSERNF